MARPLRHEEATWVLQWNSETNSWRLWDQTEQEIQSRPYGRPSWPWEPAIAWLPFLQQTVLPQLHPWTPGKRLWQEWWPGWQMELQPKSQSWLALGNWARKFGILERKSQANASIQADRSESYQAWQLFKRKEWIKVKVKLENATNWRWKNLTK